MQTKINPFEVTEYLPSHTRAGVQKDTPPLPLTFSGPAWIDRAGQTNGFISLPPRSHTFIVPNLCPTSKGGERCSFLICASTASKNVAVYPCPDPGTHRMDFMPLTNVQILSTKSWERSSSRAALCARRLTYRPRSAGRSRQRSCPWFWHLGVLLRLVLFLSCFHCSVRPPAVNVPITPVALYICAACVNPNKFCSRFLESSSEVQLVPL